MMCKVPHPEGKCILHVKMSERPCLNWYGVLLLYHAHLWKFCTVANICVFLCT